jgi:Sulfotransferase family
VWIYGSPRTGSTWLLEMLCAPLRPTQSKPLGFTWSDAWPGRAGAIPVDEFLVSSHIVPSSGGIVDLMGSKRFGTLNGYMANRPSYAFSEEFDEFWRPEIRRMTLVRLYGVIKRARDAGLDLAADLPLVVIKEVNGSHAADVVMSLFPRSKMIFLVRDGRDVLDSLTAAHGQEGFIRAKQETDLDWVRDQCERWVARVDVCSRAFESHDLELRRQIRYEDLLADTTGVVGALYEWLGLATAQGRVERVVERRSFDAVPDAKKGPGKHRRSATPGKWKEGLSPEATAVAQEVMGERLAKLGYQDDSPSS